MKLKFLAILATLTAFTINAQEVEQFEANVGNYIYMKFDKLNENECQFAAIRNVKVIENTTDEDGSLLKIVYDTPEQELFESNPNYPWGGIWYILENGFPSSVTTDDGKTYTVVGIGDFAFAQAQMESIPLQFPDNYKIGKGAFWGANVKNVDLSNLSTISDYAFYKANLNNATYDFSTITSLGRYAFAETPIKPEKIFNLTEISDYAFAKCPIENLEIPSSIKTIGAGAFYKCSQIRSLIFNEGLETICERAFEGCSAIITTAENPIKFPDSLITIKEAAFKDCSSAQNIVFGKNLQEIGDYAFYRVDIVWSPFYLPSTITKIGYDAINFQNTNSSFTDIFYPNSTPNDIDEEAFGRIGEKGLDFNDDYWIYLTVCLHVPMGTRELYENCTGWRNFKCIIDDLIPEKTPESDPTSHTDGDDPLTYIIGYAYIKPGDELNINKDVLKLGEDAQTQLKWKRIEKGTKPSENQGDNSQSGNQQNGQDLKESEEVIYEENPVVTMDSDGNVTAEKYGDKIVIAYRDGNTKVDGSGNVTQVEQTVAGAVILFVCPTITLVYDTKNETAQPGASQSLSRIRTLAEGDGTTEDEIAPVVNEATEVAQLKEDNATYEHLVVYNSYPKLMLEPASGITISDIQRAKIDQDNNYTADGALADIDKEEQLQNDGLVENAQYIVPINPVQENRVITFSGISNDDQLTTEVEDEVIQLTPEIKVVVNGLTISIEGAQPESVVTVTNTNGQVVYNAKGKTFTMTTKGVYIIRVEDVTFKALVK